MNFFHSVMTTPEENYNLALTMEPFVVRTKTGRQAVVENVADDMDGTFYEVVHENGDREIRSMKSVRRVEQTDLLAYNNEVDYVVSAVFGDTIYSGTPDEFLVGTCEYLGRVRNGDLLKRIDDEKYKDEFGLFNGLFKILTQSFDQNITVPVYIGLDSVEPVDKQAENQLEVDYEAAVEQIQKTNTERGYAPRRKSMLGELGKLGAEQYIMTSRETPEELEDFSDSYSEFDEETDSDIDDLVAAMHAEQIEKNKRFPTSPPPTPRNKRFPTSPSMTAALPCSDSMPEFLHHRTYNQEGMPLVASFTTRRRYSGLNIHE